MSSILLHGLLPAMWFKRWKWIFLVVAFQGMLPDIIGRIGIWTTGTWAAYEWAHAFHWWLAPAGWLHVTLDAMTHHPYTGEWNALAWIIEVMFWPFAFWFFRHEIKYLWRRLKKKAGQ